MRRLLSLAIAAGLAAPIGASADSSRPDSNKAPTSSDRVELKSGASSNQANADKPELPFFLRAMLEQAGVLPKEHPWVSWIKKAFRLDSSTTASTMPQPSATTASR